jgi:hypothetical protein
MENKYSGEERRKFPRANVSFIVVYRVNEPMQVSMMLGNKEVHAIMYNLSEEGLSVMTNYDIPIATIASFKFILLNDQALREDQRVKTIEVTGEVRYNRFIKERTYQIGIHFTNVNDVDRGFIAEFVRWAPRA